MTQKKPYIVGKDYIGNIMLCPRCAHEWSESPEEPECEWCEDRKKEVKNAEE